MRVPPPKPARKPAPPSWKTLGCAALIVAAVVAVYANSFSGVFVFDDLPSIRDNPSIRNVWDVGSVFFPFEGGKTVTGRPFVNFTLAVNYAISQLDTWSYHAVNLVIHLAAALTLWGLLLRTFRLPTMPRQLQSSATGLALAVAVVWAVHPLQTESVTYIVQRAESLMALFYLLTLYCLLRGATAEKARGWYVGAAICCLTGMTCKEVMVTAPVAALMYDRVFLSTSFREALRRRWGLYVAFFGAWLMLAALVWHSGTRGGTIGLGGGFSPLEYLRTECGVVAHYLGLAFWPSKLCVDYKWAKALTMADVFLPATVLLLLMAATVVAMFRWPRAGFVGACFFLILAPTSSLIPIIDDPAFEHRMYLPLAAVVAAVILGAYFCAAWCATRKPALGAWVGRAFIVAVIAAAAALGAATVNRNRVYQSELALWKDTVGTRDSNYRAWNSLGHARLKSQPQAEQLDQAFRDFSKAIELKPDYAEAYINRGIVHRRQGHPDKAVENYSLALSFKPDFAVAYANRGFAYLDMKRPDEAVRDLTRAIELGGAWSQVYVQRGLAYGLLGLLDLARQDYDQALIYDSRNIEALNNRAAVRLLQGDVAGAQADIDACRRLGASPHPNLLRLMDQAVGNTSAPVPAGTISP